ncbi:zinc finger family protein [Musa troglodytarum]|uniref:Zinc finger family protein n=2 Tax=Musa troglodytarum TaxID=320322 RepID=A0A9E7G5J9_9LILI|nr:zinc finger family protein [Musa troglodytarum]
MGGWRRAFCTSATVVASTEAGEKKQQKQIMGSSRPRSCAKLSFFSGGGGGRGGNSPSTPRLALCRTSSESPDSSKLQCDKLTSPATASVNTSGKNRSPALFRRKALSTPSSPRSPSGFALFKQLSRSRCRICSQSLRTSREMPVFTAECSHAFHLSCIAAHVRSMHGSLACPVCFATLRRARLPSALHHHQQEDAVVEKVLTGESENRNPNRKTTGGGDRNARKGGEQQQLGQNRLTAAKVYDDDEPLLIVSATNKGGGVRFNPIPEASNEDNDEYDLERENKFRGLLATPPPPRSHGGGVPRRPTTRSRAGGVQVSMMPQAALLSEGRRHRNYVVALKVKAPRMRPANLLSPAGGRTPIDLVTVLDVGQGMTADKLQMLKSKMRLVVSSMGPADRLSVVAFSAVAGAKRLLPLRRMSRQGQRAARQIVERLVVVGGGASSGEEIVADALRKATKVLEDRRERNPVATIMLLSDARQQQLQDQGKEADHNYHHTPLCSPRDAGDGDIRPHPLPMMTSASPATSYAHLAIPLHAPGFGDGAAGPSPQKPKEESSEDSFMKCVGRLASMVMRDVRLQLFLPSGQISSVYPCGGGGGGGGGCREVAPGEGSFVLHLGNLYAEEERELLVELRVPVSSSAASSPENSRHQLSVKCNYRDPAIQDVILDAEPILLLPPLLHSHPELSQAASSSSCSATSQWLRKLFVSTRALAESRRLADLSDYATAHHLLSSARSLLRRSACDAQDHGLIQNLEAELADLERRRLLRKQHQLPRHQEQQEESLSPSNRRRRRRESPAEVRGEQLTSASAWRAAEQLAKVAIMRKSLNRVGDLHGFENARF